MNSGPIRGKLPDRPISAFKSQGIKYHIPVLTVRLVSTGLAGGCERAVDLGTG